MLAKTVLVGCLVWPQLASGEPVVVVDEAAPFSAQQLSDAVKLRVTPKGDVRVTRNGNVLVIEVGDASETVTIEEGDPREAARVVAMVIVALDGRADRARLPDGDANDDETPAVFASAAAPVQLTPSRWAVRATVGKILGGSAASSFHPLSAAISYSLGEHSRVVASTSLIWNYGDPWPKEHYNPYRLGLEGRAGAIGLELGGFVARQSDCVAGDFIAYGGYFGARVYAPMTSRSSFVLEAMAYYAIDQAYGCGDISVWRIAGPEPMEVYGTQHGTKRDGWLGAGFEWQL
jgi:hypothetical protein